MERRSPRPGCALLQGQAAGVERGRPELRAELLDGRVCVVREDVLHDAHATVEEFRAELWSATFDARRLALE